MADFLDLAQPLILMVILAVWVYCIVDALRNHRPWAWVIALVALPVLSAPFYLLNFKLFGSAEGGRLDVMLGDSRRLRELKEEARVRDVAGVHREIADIYFRRGNYDMALEALKRVLDLDPEDLRSQYQAGASMVATGRAAEAIPHLEYVVEEEPRYGYGEARLVLANAYMALRDQDRAFEEYSRLVESHNLPEAVVKHARLLRARGDEETARRELKEMLNSVTALPKDRLEAYRPWIRQAADDLRNMG